MILSSLIDICLADGEIEEPEIAVISEIMEALLGSPVSDTELRTLAESRRAATASPGSSHPFDDLVKRLATEQAQLDDNSRALILESAFRVACSDGEVEEQEYERLVKLADALGIYRGVLEMEIDQFQRHQTMKQ